MFGTESTIALFVRMVPYFHHHRSHLFTVHLLLYLSLCILNVFFILSTCITYLKSVMTMRCLKESNIVLMANSWLYKEATWRNQVYITKSMSSTVALCDEATTPSTNYAECHQKLRFQLLLVYTIFFTALFSDLLSLWYFWWCTML